MLQTFRGHLGQSALISDASRSSKSQENGLFHRNVWQGLMEAQFCNEYAQMHPQYIDPG